MKLSVKWLAGLTLMALVAVAVVGLSHSASAAADGKVYVTNKASKLTTEASAPAGRTSATTVYGTYASAVTSGTSARDIVTGADTFIVTVVDSDLNTTEVVTDDNGSSYNFAVAAAGDIIEVNDSGAAGFTQIGDQFRIVLADATKPIIGTASDIKVIAVATSEEVTGLTVAGIFAAGDGATAPVITVSVVGATPYTTGLRVVYPSSAVNATTASIKSVVDTVGTVVTLTETGRNTGRFEGYVQVVERTSSVTQGVNGGAVGSPATIPAIGGPITVKYVDAVTSGAAVNSSRTSTFIIDVTAPTATLTTPATGSETQNRLPSFSGTVTDNQSGLDVSAFALHIDDTTDELNATMVITAGSNQSDPTIIGKVADTSTSTTGKLDGVSTLPFTYTESVVLPNAAVTNPNHIVDFQVRAADLAGNYGYSDAKTAVGNIGGTGRHGNQPHTIKIDQKIPSISSAESGIGLDTSVAPSVDKENVRDTIKVTFDGKLKDTSVSASDFQVVLSGAGGTFVPASIVVKDAVVYLDLDSTIPSDNTPLVKIQGTVQDLAGNSTDAGSATASDKLAPVITVTRSGGSGTGTGSSAADSLTSDKMTITVSSDEDLQGPPAITVTDLTVTPAVGNVNNGTLGVAQGSNTWSLVVTKGASPAGGRALKVTATDSASNTATSGKDTTQAYTLDLIVEVPESTPGSTTTQANPFFTTDFTALIAEQSTVAVVSATLDAVDVTADVVASTDSKTFFFQPTTALTNAKHTYILKVKDAAGNTKTITAATTKSDRKDYEIGLFAGWNLFSLPSNPLDTDVNTVLSNTGIKQVVAYDATTPLQPWRIASKVGAGAYSSTTTPGLTNVGAGPGYWLETANFEDQKVALEGPTGPGDARPGLTEIPTGTGWNLVGVVDQSREQTQSGDKGAILTRPNAAGTATNVTVATYFNTVANGRAYKFNTVGSEFRELVAADVVNNGDGIWVFISAQSNGSTPPIVP